MGVGLGAAAEDEQAVAGLDGFLELVRHEDGRLLLVAHHVDELHAGQLQKLDRLLQLGCHDQLLGQPEVLLDLYRHGEATVPSNLAPQGRDGQGWWYTNCTHQGPHLANSALGLGEAASASLARRLP